MKAGKKITFLTIVIAMFLTACGGGSHALSSGSISVSESSQTSSSETSSQSESSSTDISSDTSSSESSSSSEETREYAVQFVVEGTVVQETMVKHGQFATYTGDKPTKAATAGISKYEFRGWSPNSGQQVVVLGEFQIVSPTTFTAIFGGYVDEVLLDDFESYDDSASMLDEGWVALGYSNASNTWTDQTKASVSLGINSVEGEKALRFDAWENGVGYKFAKKFPTNTYSGAVNALQFRLMVPSINTVKIILCAEVKIQGQTMAPTFTYTLPVTSSEYVDYVIPLDADGWALWGDASKTIKSVSEWTGIHQDDLLPFLNGIEFYVQGSDGANGLPYIAFLDSVRFVNVLNPAYTANEDIEICDTYTAYTNQGNIARVQLNETRTSASVGIIDVENPVETVCDVEIRDGELNLSSHSDSGKTITYTGTITDAGKTIKHTYSSGTYANAFNGVNFVGVQVVENFENYEDSGVAYYKENTPADRSGFRGAYYAERYTDTAGDTSPWGGAKWDLLPSGDEMYLVSSDSVSHSGSKCGRFKNAQQQGYRYMQWGLFDGSSQKNSFRGSYLGFWAKTEGVVKSFLAYLYSQTSPTNATRTSYVKSYNFHENAAVGEWKHYQLELNPNVVYYGVMFYLEANWTADSYLFIDDVEVYSADPYAVYVPPEPVIPEPAVSAGMTFNIPNANGLSNAHLEFRAENKVFLNDPANGVDAEGVYAVNDNTVTLSIDSVVYSGLVSEDHKIITKSSITGTGDVANVLNSVNSMNRIEYADNVEAYTEDGVMYSQKNTDEKATSGARAAYYCDYYAGSGNSPVGGNGWLLMGGEADQLRLDKTHAVEGKNSLLVKRSSAGSMRYLQWGLYKGNAKAITGYDSFAVYLRNSSSYDVKVNIMVYKAQGLTVSTQGADYRSQTGLITIPAHTDWTPYVVELNPAKTYYGYGLVFEYGDTAWINVDAAHYFNQGEDNTLLFKGKSGVGLDANLSAGTATFLFGNDNEITFNCGSINNLQGSYTMALQSPTTQIMTVTFDSATVKGTYSVNSSGTITFTVTEVTGGLTDTIHVGDVFVD